jgi:tetratricopeptide (TPR) repeat protein
MLADLVKDQPGNLALQAQYGFALLRARRLDEAEKVFVEVLKNDPDNRDTLRHYAALLSERLETSRADDLLKKLQGLEPDDADVAFRRALNFLEAPAGGGGDGLNDLGRPSSGRRRPRRESRPWTGSSGTSPSSGRTGPGRGRR